MPGARQSTRLSTVAARTETCRTGRRPTRSEMMLTGTTATASSPVVADTVSAAVVGETCRFSLIDGSSAWVRYMALKDARPAVAAATMTRR